MASVIHHVTARELLEYAIGKKRVSLKELTGEEFDEFLQRVLEGVDLRELRGFKPLRDVLRSENFTVAKEVRFITPRAEDGTDWAGLDTYFYGVSMGWENLIQLFARHESKETTNDWKVANEWGESCYLASGSGSIMVLRRAPNHEHADENLAIIDFKFEKVPHEDRQIFFEIEVRRLPVSEFRTTLKDRYPILAWNLIDSLRCAHSQTVDALRSQLTSMAQRHATYERLAEAIFCS